MADFHQNRPGLSEAMGVLFDCNLGIAISFEDSCFLQLALLVDHDGGSDL